MSSVEMNRMLTEMRLAIAQAQNAQQSPHEISKTQQNFGNVFTDALNNVNELQQNASSLQTRFEMNDPNVDLADVMIASQKSKVAFAAAMEVRNKFVDAYKEIMNMPI